MKIIAEDGLIRPADAWIVPFSLGGIIAAIVAIITANILFIVATLGIFIASSFLIFDRYGAKHTIVHVLLYVLLCTLGFIVFV